MATLKISDLSVGDWVRYDGKEYQVQCVDGLSEMVTLFGYCEQREESAGNLRFIPITAEILENNGFECDKGEPDEAFYGDSSNIFHTKGTLHYVLVTDEVSVVCFFIHQLQHALRLAGVEEEINL